tara:strand:+ start:132 stop:548 length:417 start_codon:yes stop_codon:yes gene_type:complete
MDEEEFVASILKDRVDNKLSSTKEIHELNDRILVDIYSNYMNYEKNKENLVSAREKLKEYYYSNNNFSKGEYVTYINPKYFYDLRIHKGGFVTSIEGNMLRLVNGRSVWGVDMRKIRIFTKLNEDQKLKLIIIDTFEE